MSRSENYQIAVARLVAPLLLVPTPIIIIHSRIIKYRPISLSTDIPVSQRSIYVIMTSLQVRQEATIQRLVREYENRPCNVTQLAKANHVPYQRLNARLKRKRPQRGRSKASHATLTPEQETELIQYVDFLDILGDKALQAELSAITNRILYTDDQDRRAASWHAFGASIPI